MKCEVDGLEIMERKETALAALRVPLSDGFYSRRTGFSIARMLAEGGMGWVWCQWLRESSGTDICDTIEHVVSRGIEIQERMTSQYMRGVHDLFLLHCALFASSQTQLERLAERVIDALGPNGALPPDDGDLFAGAWCGMLKYLILGDKERATSQYDILWDAYRPPYFRAATKPLVTPFLEENWDAFVVQQKKDFERLWGKAKKGGIVKSKKGHATVNVRKFSIAQSWCWAHCGMAMLAHRQGIPVATDPFWFPSHALTVIGKPRESV